MSGQAKVGETYLNMARLCLARWSDLLRLGVLVFVPLGLIDAAVDLIPDIQTGATFATIAAVFVFFLLQTLSTLLGEVFYSGAVAGMLNPEGPEQLSPRHLLRSLPFARLVAADLVFAVVVLLGFLALIVPGVIFFTWFGIVAPVIEIENRTVRKAFARSRELVRGHFWTVLLVLGPLTVASDLISEGSTSLSGSLLGHGFFAEWVGEIVGGVLSGPLYAVPAVLLMLKLSGRGVPRDAAG